MYADHQCGETAWRMNLLTRSFIQLVGADRVPAAVSHCQMLGLPDPGLGLETGRQVINRVTSSPTLPTVLLSEVSVTCGQLGSKNIR